MGESGIKNVWVTTNRACNLRCKWCYAAPCGFKEDDDLDVELGCKLIELASGIDSESVIFLGGEPLLYGYIWQLIEFAAKKGLKTALVTNASLFSEENCKRAKNSGLSEVGVSIKAGSPEQYLKLTTRDIYYEVKKSMDYLTFYGLNWNSGIILNEFVQNDLIEMVKFGAQNGCGMTGIEFCSPVFGADGVSNQYMMEPSEITKIITRDYSEIDRITKGKVSIGIMTPLCTWPHEFIEMLKSKKQICTQCQLACHTGLIFDVYGKVLACNCLSGYPLGQFGKDFSDVHSFANWWTSEEVDQIYKSFTNYPHVKCQLCKKYDDCGGGCPTQWFVRDPEQIIGG